jgi:LuxR family maltose regulon positive regulatory protein
VDGAAQPTPTPGPEARALIEAKLRPPRLSPRLIARPALVARLDAAADRVLTLVAAPTGYGKTTALATWAAGRPRTAWVALDATDDEPIRFARAIVAAIRRVDLDLGTSTLELLDDPAADVTGSVRIALVNELEDLDEPVTLVLDDLHAIRDATCLSLVEALLAARPYGLRLVIATRADPGLPLGRLRAAGLLAELRAADLRFGTAEAGALLHEVLGRDVPPETIDRLTARTEGWPAGLALAALSAEAALDPQRFVDGFSGSDRTVVDYLAEEVLAAQPPETRAFLMATSVAEELTGDLCDALTGAAAGDGAQRLEVLARANAFVVRLDSDGRWFRYHRLFREMLLAELAATDPTAGARLLLAAAAWYEAHGLTEQAARAALAAGDPTEAARLLTTSAREVMRQGDLAMLRVLLADLDRDAIGPMVSAVEVAEALAAGLAGESQATIDRHLALAEAAGPLATRPFGLPDVATARLFTDAAYLQDDVGRQARAAAVLRERFPDHPLLGWLGRAAAIDAAYFAGHPAAARAEAADFGIEVQPRVLLLSIVVVAIASLIATESGDLSTGEMLARRAHDATVAGRLADAHAAGLAHAALGAALAARGEHESALIPLERSLELRGRHPGVHRAHALLALAPVRGALGELAAAHALVDEARSVIAACADPGALPALLGRTLDRIGPKAAMPAAPARPSEAQLRVLQLLPSELSYREIGRELFLSHDTIKSHIRALYRILGVDTRQEAVERARTLGLLQDESIHPG